MYKIILNFIFIRNVLKKIDNIIIWKNIDNILYVVYIFCVNKKSFNKYYSFFVGYYGYFS